MRRPRLRPAWPRGGRRATRLAARCRAAIMWPSPPRCSSGSSCSCSSTVWFQPLGQWDAWSQWTAKARSLVVFHGLNAGFFESAPYRPVESRTIRCSFPSIEASDFTFMRPRYASDPPAVLPPLRGLPCSRSRTPARSRVGRCSSGRSCSRSRWRRRCRSRQPPHSPTFLWRSCSHWPASSPGAGSFDADRVALRLFAAVRRRRIRHQVRRADLRRSSLGHDGRLVAAQDRVRAPGNDGRRRRRARRARAVVALGRPATRSEASSRPPPQDRFSGDLIDKVGRIPPTLVAHSGTFFNPTRWLLIGLRRRRRPSSSPSRVLPRPCARRGLSPAPSASASGPDPRLLGDHRSSCTRTSAHSARRVVTGPVLFAAVLAPLLLEAVLGHASARNRARQCSTLCRP